MKEEQFKIPKSFSLFGEEHKVKLVKLIDRGKSLGEWNPDNNTIKISTTGRSDDSMEQTYLHELIHAILDHLSYEHLSNDEKFVDTFSKALHQTLKTAKY